MPTILLVGADQSLLHTRAAILRKTGARTVCASASAALAQQNKYNCELLILCHTLPDRVGVALVRIFRDLWPESRILQMLPHRDWGTRSAASLADAICYAEPERLIVRTNELLRRWDAFHRADVAPTASAYLH